MTEFDYFMMKMCTMYCMWYLLVFIMFL